MTAKAYLIRYRTLPDLMHDLVTEMNKLFEQKDCIYERFPSCEQTGLPHGYDTSDPTFNKIELLEVINSRLEYIGNQYKDIDTEIYRMDKLLESLTEMEKALIQYRYIFAKTLYPQEIMNRLGIRKDKYYALEHSAFSKIEEGIKKDPC